METSITTGCGTDTEINHAFAVANCVPHKDDPLDELFPCWSHSNMSFVSFPILALLWAWTTPSSGYHDERKAFHLVVVFVSDYLPQLPLITIVCLPRFFLERRD